MEALIERVGGEREPRAAFFIVRPEEAGFRKQKLSEEDVPLVFDGWLGDDLIAAHPTFLATHPLKEALVSLEKATGFRPRRARTICSSFLERTNPGLKLPPLWVLEVDGTPGTDDMGVTLDGSLVVSQRTLDVLVQHRVGRAVFAVFRRASRPSSVLERHLPGVPT